MEGGHRDVRWRCFSSHQFCDEGDAGRRHRDGKNPLVPRLITHSVWHVVFCALDFNTSSVSVERLCRGEAGFLGRTSLCILGHSLRDKPQRDVTSCRSVH